MSTFEKIALIVLFGIGVGTLTTLTLSPSHKILALVVDIVAGGAFGFFIGGL
jgi:hypothetical protein